MLALNLRTRYDVAALYVERGGPYFDLLGEDRCWDEARDARTYAGPWPIVAHPPCGPWGDLATKSKETTKELAVHALTQVRKYGGILEHPHHSKLFDAFRLPRPGELPDSFGGFTVHLEQVSWGHPCRKPTRLYIVGHTREVERSIRTGGEPTHQIWGSARSGHRHRTDLKAAHAGMRRRTPPAFAEWLCRLAEQAKRP